MFNALIFFGGLAVIIVLAILWHNSLSEGEKWDLAANAMHMEGYTEFDIYDELGPRPKD